MSILAPKIGAFQMDRGNKMSIFPKMAQAILITFL
jgi:hypothetical protein